MLANNTIFLKRFVLAGLSITRLPRVVVKPGIETGELVDLLPEIECPPLVLYAVYPQLRLAPRTASVCVSYLKDFFAERTAVACYRGLRVRVKAPYA